MKIFGLGLLCTFVKCWIVNKEKKKTKEAASREKTIDLGLWGNIREKQEGKREKKKVDQGEATLLGK